jgi:hypothetical protein
MTSTKTLLRSWVEWFAVLVRTILEFKTNILVDTNVPFLADPLAATFAQAYVARKAQEVEPNFKVHLNTAFQDLMMYQSVCSLVFN